MYWAIIAYYAPIIYRYAPDLIMLYAQTLAFKSNLAKFNMNR